MSIIFAILLFSVLVFVHEFGHFITAKLSGVQVNEFSIFMGPALVKWKRGETLYAIRCIPFGGYCAMEGEDEESQNPRAFSRAKWWKKLCILISGPAMNFVMGFLLVFAILLPADGFLTPKIMEMDDGSALAENGGIQPGDVILEIDDETVYIQSDFNLILSARGEGVYDVLVLRDGEEVLLKDVNFERRTFGEETASRFGVTFGEVEEADLLTTLKYTWLTSLDYVRSVKLGLEMLFNGSASVSDMSGPVGIVNTMSEVTETQESFGDKIMVILEFGALISINLAVMNLLPIPALDGGRAVCLVLTVIVEKITRKKLDPKYERYLHAGGMVLLLGFMVIITFKDIIGLF